MQQAQILSILYDMALVIGGEDRRQPLLLNTLQRFMYHTAFPCGMILLREPGEADMRLRVAIGDHRLAEHVGETFTLPESSSSDTPALVEGCACIGALPLHEGRYRVALRLPIPSHGLVLLLGPAHPGGEAPFAEMFRPVLANFARAIDLCRANEAYAAELIADRDQARTDLVRFRSAMDSSSDYVFLLDPERMRFVDFNRTVEAQLGFSRDELESMGLQDLTPSHAEADWRGQFELMQRDPDYVPRVDALHQRKDGSRFPVEVRMSVLRQANRPPVLIALSRDITERKLAEEALFQEKERAQVTLYSIGDAVITTDPAGRVDYLNPIAEQMTGWRHDEARGLPVGRVFNIVNERTRQPVENPVQLVFARGRIVGVANHSLLISRDGKERAIEDSAAPIRDRQGDIIGVVMVFHDVTKTRELARQLSWQATHDSLTGLVNRQEFEYRLERALKSAREHGDAHVLLYLDLDQFKLVNDTSGHTAGDELLKHLTVLLQGNVREADVLARLGGDEFGLLLENCPLDQARRIAEKIRQGVSEFRFVWQDRTFDVGVSIGLAVIDPKAESTAAVLSAADLACYAAKELGRNRIQVYQQDDAELARRLGEMDVVSIISDALENERFRLFAQRIVPLVDGREPVHHELLLRMQSADGKVLTPGAFIPAAERYNLMPTVDRWVIENVAKAISRGLKKRRGRVLPAGVYAVNLSGTSLGRDDLLEFITATLAAHAVPPELICFEITETAAIANLSRASRLIHELRALGCRFALDDFGSGFSSFGYLKALPVDYLKIDGSFIHDMLADPMDLAVVESVNHIGHILGKKTIAEFVENNAIAAKLKELGVDFAQGYGIERPKPFQAVDLVTRSR